MDMEEYKNLKLSSEIKKYQPAWIDNINKMIKDQVECEKKMKKVLND